MAEEQEVYVSDKEKRSRPPVHVTCLVSRAMIVTLYPIPCVDVPLEPHAPDRLENTKNTD